MTQEHDCRRRGIHGIPSEQSCPISSLKPTILKRQPTAGFPVLIHPRLWMVDEELVEKADGVPVGGE
jgi:hypothetical protein